MNKSDTEIPKISLPGSTLAAVTDTSTCGNKAIAVSVPTRVCLSIMYAIRGCIQSFRN